MSCADFVVIHFRADFVILCEMFESDFVEECSVNVISCDNDFFFFFWQEHYAVLVFCAVMIPVDFSCGDNLSPPPSKKKKINK